MKKRQVALDWVPWYFERIEVNGGKVMWDGRTLTIQRLGLTEQGKDALLKRSWTAIEERLREKSVRPFGGYVRPRRLGTLRRHANDRHMEAVLKVVTLWR